MDNKEKNFISAVIYVHNAEDCIGRLLDTVIFILEKNFEHSEIICVNDDSNDNSLAVIKAASDQAQLTSISVINMSYYHGLELAMNAGVDMAIGDFVLEFDHVVLDYNPSLIMDVYRHSLQGYDIVSASPDRKQSLTSLLFYNVFDRYADLSYKMTTESFRILSRRVINRISLTARVVPYRKAMYANCGLKTDVIQYHAMQERNKKRDQREKKYRRRLAMDSLILFTEAGYRFSMAMTTIMMAITIFAVLYILFTYFTAHPVEGWTTTLLFLSACFFGLFGILTIIVKYLQLLMDMVFKRKHYSFESTEKLTKQ